MTCKLQVIGLQDAELLMQGGVDRAMRCSYTFRF